MPPWSAAGSVCKLVERELLSVESGIGEMVNPVAENHHMAPGNPQGEVDEDVAVAKHEVVNPLVGVGAEPVAAEGYQRLAVLPLEAGGRGGEMARVVAPAVGEGDGPAGMDGGIEFLAETVAEGGADKAEGARQPPYAIAVA